MIIQIFSTGKNDALRFWQDEALAESIRSDPHYSGMMVAWDVRCFREVKKEDAIIISLISTKDADVAKHLIEDARTNERHFVFCEKNLFLGVNKKQYQEFLIINLYKLTPERVLKAIRMMIKRFQK